MSAQVAITQLPAAGAITGTEAVPIVQNGVTVQTTTGAISASPSQIYQYLTAIQTPALPNSRYLSGGTGIGLTDGLAQGPFTVYLNGTSGSLEAAGNGIVVKSSGVIVPRSIATSGTGVTVSNGSGVSGNPTIALDGLPAALASVSGTGLLNVVSGSAIGSVSILGTANQVTVANGNASAGSPTISITDNVILPGTGAMTVPKGTTAEQPGGSDGQFRFNTSTSTFDGYAAGSWRQFSLAGGVTTFSGGSTGLTPAVPTSGAVTLGGTLIVANGGTGANTLTGYVYGNGTSTMTASTTIPNTDITGLGTMSTQNANAVAITGGAINGTTIGASTPSTGAFTTLSSSSTTVLNGTTIPASKTLVDTDSSQTLTNKSMSGASNTFTNLPNAALDNSAITINGSSVSLGGSVTVTATASNALTIGTGLSGTSYNGSTAVTIAIDSTVATLTGAQTLTNKTISGASNTLTNIGNGSLSNSSVTIGSDPLSLGGTLATLNGVSISGSANTLSNIANASLTNSSITLGTTNIALGGTSLAPVGLTSVTVTQDPTTALQLATKQYVDTLASSGIHYHAPVYLESPDTAGNLNATYNNGSSGVGATLTNAGTQAALTIDGVLTTVGMRVLIYNQTNAAQNGVYTVTVVGDGSTNWVLTRATDADTYAPFSPNSLGQGDAFFVQAGATGIGETYICTTVGTITFGTTAITFAQISSAQVYTAGTGLTLTGTQFSISNTAVTAAAYGSASKTLTATVNAQGQLTALADTNIAIAASQVTSGTLAVAQGGTNIASYTTGDLIYASGTTALSQLAIGANGYVLTSNGTIPAYAAQSTLAVGTATNLAGGIASQIPYQTGAGATSFIANGTAGQVLTSAGTGTPTWSGISGGTF